MTSPIEESRIMVGQDLSQAGATINNYAQQIVDEMNTVGAQVEYLREHWQGWTPQVYDPLMTQWQAAAWNLFAPAQDGGLLGAIAAAMDVTFNNYTDGEIANVRTWTSAG
jgi:hypothetical protein